MGNILYILIAFIVVVDAAAAIAAGLTNNFLRRIILSILLGFLFCFAGLWISYELELASGASIVLLAGTTYLLLKLRIYFTHHLKSLINS